MRVGFVVLETLLTFVSTSKTQSVEPLRRDIFNLRALKILSYCGIWTILYTGIIDKDAHASIIYLPEGGLYSYLAWAIVYYQYRAVQSLTIVIFNSSHDSYFIILTRGSRKGKI